ncbi:MAG: sensor histidine kinase [Campylobacterales bacterium]
MKIKFCAVFLKIAMLLAVVHISVYAEPNLINLDKKGWEYRWGDSPFVGEKPEWSLNANKYKWEQIDFPSNPKNRDGKTNIWYRIQLPEILPPDPSIYIYSVDLITEVYLDEKMIYGFGKFNEEGKGSFEGWPWHLISIPEDSGAKYIYFRVFSNYPDIGLWGEVLLGSKGDILEKLLKDDLLYIVSGTIALFVGVMLILAFLGRFRDVEIISLGLLFTTQGLNLLLNAKTLQLFFDYPLLSQYLYAASYFFLPVGIAAFLESVVGKGYFSVVRRIWQIHLVYLVLSLSGALLGLYFLSDTYLYYDYLFYFVSWPLLTFVAIMYFKRASVDAKLSIVGFMILSIFWFYSTLISWNIVPWEQGPNYLPIALCLSFFGFVLLRKFFRAEELKQTNIALESALYELSSTQSKLLNLNKSLESKVKEEVAKRREHEHLLMQNSKMATMGEMVGAIGHQLTQPLSVMLLNIEYIKDELNDKADKEIIQDVLDKLVVQVWHMSDTIRHFSSFLKPSRHKEIFDTKNAVLEVHKLIDLQIQQHNIRLVIQGEGFKTLGYSNEIKHAVLNIINNAKDVLNERNIEDKEIVVQLESDKNCGIIKIMDNAGGIPEELLPDKLFEAYVSTKGDRGTGIGLQLSRSIIETRMEGKIFARNNSKGAEFVIELPIVN